MSIGSGVGGLVGGIASMISGPGANYRGKIKRSLEAETASLDRGNELYNAAIAGSTNPLFRSTALSIEAPLRRAISEGILANYRQAASARARGLTGGMRSDIEDQSRYLAASRAFTEASDTAQTGAFGRLMQGAQGMAGLAGGYGNVASGW